MTGPVDDPRAANEARSHDWAEEAATGSLRRMLWQLCLAIWAIAAAFGLLIWLGAGSDAIGMAVFFVAQIASCVLLFRLDRRDPGLTELASLLFAGANLVVTLGRWRWELVAVAALATLGFVLLSVHRLPHERPATLDPDRIPLWWAAIGLVVAAILSVPAGWVDPALECILWCE